MLHSDYGGERKKRKEKREKVEKRKERKMEKKMEKVEGENATHIGRWEGERGGEFVCVWAKVGQTDAVSKILQ